LDFPRQILTFTTSCAQKNGVYAVTVDCMGKTFQGVANIGYSPTFDDHVFSVEVHILDFNENIYGQNIRVNFVQRIRDEEKFSNISELSDEIKKDILKARKILS
jgi:riboflavin kinase/FMN adenylyltransferase